MAVFEMQNARKAFGALEVLKGVSLKVEKGEVVSIIGPSGGGKSTMLRCATLLETMDSGTLAYGENVAAREENGKSVYAGKAALAQVRRQFGLVFQQFDLFPHYTVLKNVCDAPISVQKRDKAEVEAEAMALLDYEVDSERTQQNAAMLLTRRFGCASLVKGGHLVNEANDVLAEPAPLDDEGNHLGDPLTTWFRHKRIDTNNTHGTGCTLSSAIACALAQGMDLADAVNAGKAYLTGALAAGLNMGKGSGPVNHMWQY